MTRRSALDTASLACFWRHLGSLLAAGMPLPSALVAVGRDAGVAELRRTSESLGTAVAEGAPLSEALRRFPGTFDTGTLACVTAGERAGDLASASRTIAAYAERAETMRLRGRMVLAYPLIVFAFCVLLTWVFLLRAVPVLWRLDSEIPWTAQILVTAAPVLQGLLAVAVLAALGLAAVYRMPGALPGVRRCVEQFLFRLPLWGRYHQAVILARFARSLALLLRCATPFHEALVLAGAASGSLVAEERTRAAAAAVAEGRRAMEVLSGAGPFPPAALWALRIAEERGDLVEVLDGLASYYDETAAIHGATFLTTAEPVAILVVGLVGLFTVLAVVVPGLSVYALIE